MIGYTDSSFSFTLVRNRHLRTEVPCYWGVLHPRWSFRESYAGAAAWGEDRVDDKVDMRRLFSPAYRFDLSPHFCSFEEFQMRSDLAGLPRGS